MYINTHYTNTHYIAEVKSRNAFATYHSTGAFVDQPPAMKHHILKMKNLMRNVKLNYNFVNDDSKLLVLNELEICSFVCDFCIFNKFYITL